MYTGETGVDEKGGVAVSITALFVYRGVIHGCPQEVSMYTGGTGVDERGGVAVSITNDYYYDAQLPINHVISKTVLHLVTVCITSQKHNKHMLKVCRKFSKKFNI